MNIKKMLAGLACALLMVGTASAHTISMGSFNAGAPGSVTLVMGTYNHGGAIFQGSVTLVAGPAIPPTVTKAFTSAVTTKPVGLIDGNNNFYADAHGSGNWGNLPANSFSTNTNLVGLGPVVNWQGATFTGLTAGVYTYQLNGMTSANWTNVNDFSSNWRGTLIISGTSTGEVPEPGTLAIWSVLGLGAMLYRRRRRS